MTTQPAADKGYTALQFADAILRGLGDPVTKANEQALVAWEAQEGGHWHNSARFNPLNTTQKEPGSTNTGKQGNIQAYTSWEQGLQGTLQTLTNGRYEPILASLKAGNDPHATANAVNASPWGTKGVNVDANYSSYGGGQKGGGGFLDTVTGIALAPVHLVEGAVSGAADAGNAVVSSAEAVGKVTTTLFSLSFWIRVAFILTGFALIFIGTKAMLSSGEASVENESPEQQQVKQQAKQQKRHTEEEAAAAE